MLYKKLRLFEAIGGKLQDSKWLQLELRNCHRLKIRHEETTRSLFSIKFIFLLLQTRFEVHHSCFSFPVSIILSMPSSFCVHSMVLLYFYHNYLQRYLCSFFYFKKVRLTCLLAIKIPVTKRSLCIK